MCCQTKRKILSVIIVFILTFFLIQTTYATTYHLSLDTNIKDGMKIHFGNEWISTNDTDALITAWFENDWVNVTVYNIGIQQVYTGEKPRLVYINNVQADENDGWSYSDGITIVVGATSSFNLFLSSLIPKQFSPLFSLIGILCVLALCFGMYQLVISKKFSDFDKIVGLIICTVIIAYIFIQAITYLFTY